MNEERWSAIKLKINESFKVLEEYTEDLNPGTAEVIEFEMPMGILKASYIVKPKMLGKKTLYSNRAGGDIRVDYEFSETETVARLEIEKWNDSQEIWEPIKESLF